MCFSATASFAASGCLTIIGLLCIAKNKINRALPFAAIPLIFATQQAAEGLLWLSFTHDWFILQKILPYLFLFFAFFLWPIWIPLSLVLIEPSATRRHYLAIFLMVGLIIGIYLYHFVLLHGVQATPLHCHIYYALAIPPTAAAVELFAYLVATVFPFFICSQPIMWCVGSLLAAAYIISYIWYLHHLISLWCFFAAILSSFIYSVISKIKYERWTA